MALTQTRAEARSQCIIKKSISYDFHLSLQSGNSYSGLAQICFQLTNVPTQLALDFKSKNIQKVIINGEIAVLNYEDGFILLNVQKLKVGHNRVCVQYKNKYDNDGSGCCSFVDVDSKQYLYTQFESYFANRVFPVFDQPDLKATMRLNIICPSVWKVLSNEYSIVQENFNAEKYLETAQTHHKEQLTLFLKDQKGKMSLFPQCKLLPTYLFCFVAGEYVELALQAPNRYKNIPMSLYCIESLFEHMKVLSSFIFQITIESMKFFQSFFGYEFAFSKYDQIFAHQYKWGAMQNAGIVTFNDLYIFKEKVSTQRMLRFANTISHELAHHWFGNLVTMKWWDDLWLNQSFADFISHFCLEKIKDNCKTINYESSMAAFLNRKGWGYHQDQMITTHSIRGSVPNTSVADSIFDGITYSKGAATMKQLLFLMKQENFSKALSTYFHQYQWNNATLIDFMAHMNNNFSVKQVTLDQWRQCWLEKPSLNIIQATWNPDDKSQKALIKITQTPFTQTYPTLRPHKIKIGLFKQDESIDVIETLIEPQTQNQAFYNGQNNYKAILLNFEDHTFAKNIIDPISLKYFQKNLNKISDILSRTLIWRTFFEMVKDGKMKTQRYVDIAIQSLANQKSDGIFEGQFDFIHSSIVNYTPIIYREAQSERMFNYILNLIPKIQQEQKNRLVVLKSKLPSFASSQKAKQILLDWYMNKNEVMKNHQMTVGQQWTAIVKAFTLQNLSLEQKQKLFEQQTKKDPSDTSKNHRLTCDGLKATKEQFQNIYKKFQDKNNQLSITAKNYLAHGWNSQVHKQWLLEYRERYFSDIIKMSAQLQGDHFQFFYENLAPIDDDLDLQIQSYQKIKLGHQKLDKHTRSIMKIIDNLKRRRNAYKLYQITSSL